MHAIDTLPDDTETLERLVLERIAEHPINRVGELPPWNLPRPA